MDANETSKNKSEKIPCETLEMDAKGKGKCDEDTHNCVNFQKRIEDTKEEKRKK